MQRAGSARAQRVAGHRQLVRHLGGDQLGVQVCVLVVPGQRPVLAHQVVEGSQQALGGAPAMSSRRGLDSGPGTAQSLPGASPRVRSTRRSSGRNTSSSMPTPTSRIRKIAAITPGMELKSLPCLR